MLIFGAIIVRSVYVERSENIWRHVLPGIPYNYSRSGLYILLPRPFLYYGAISVGQLQYRVIWAHQA